MLLVPAPGVAVRTGDRLALPMNQIGTDRIVSVAGGGRELPGRLIQGKRQQVSAGIGRPVDARLPWRHLGTLPYVEGGKDFDPCIARMNLERHFRVG